MQFSGDVIRVSVSWAMTNYNVLCSHNIVKIINRFHVSARTFSDRSQMTSNCVKNKSCTRAAGEYVIEVFTTLLRFQGSFTGRAAIWTISLQPTKSIPF